MTWRGADLRASREALGLSQTELAAAVKWKQTRISECEHGRRRVPDWLTERLTELETIRDDLADEMIEAVKDAPDSPLIVHQTDATFHETYPELGHVPAAVQRVAAALAAAEIEAATGNRPRLVWWGEGEAEGAE